MGVLCNKISQKFVPICFEAYDLNAYAISSVHLVNQDPIITIAGIFRRVLEGFTEFRAIRSVLSGLVIWHPTNGGVVLRRHKFE
nr:hypothetical transcript [Hymenolepis microstoma]